MMTNSQSISKNSFISIGLVISFIIVAFWGGFELGRLKTDVHSMKKDIGEIKTDIKSINSELVLIRLNRIK